MQARVDTEGEVKTTSSSGNPTSPPPPPRHSLKAGWRAKWDPTSQEFYYVNGMETTWSPPIANKCPDTDKPSVAGMLSRLSADKRLFETRRTLSGHFQLQHKQTEAPTEAQPSPSQVTNVEQPRQYHGQEGQEGHLAGKARKAKGQGQEGHLEYIMAFQSKAALQGDPSAGKIFGLAVNWAVETIGLRFNCKKVT